MPARSYAFEDIGLNIRCSSGEILDYLEERLWTPLLPVTQQDARCVVEAEISITDGPRFDRAEWGARVIARQLDSLERMTEYGYHIEDDGSRLHFEGSFETKACYHGLASILMFGLSIHLEASGWRCFHAAAVCKGSTGVVICGPKGRGKTTLAYQLCRHGGFRLLSNDKVYVRREGDRLRVIPFLQNMRLGLGLIRSEPGLERLWHEMDALDAPPPGIPDKGQLACLESWSAWYSDIKVDLSRAEVTRYLGFPWASSADIHHWVFPRLVRYQSFTERLPVPDDALVPALRAELLYPYTGERQRSVPGVDPVQDDLIEALTSTCPFHEIWFGGAPESTVALVDRLIA